MSTPPEKSDSQPSIATELRRLRHAVLMGFAVLFLIPCLYCLSLGPLAFFIGAGIYLLHILAPYIRQTALYQEIRRALHDPSAVATPNPPGTKR